MLHADWRDRGHLPLKALVCKGHTPAKVSVFSPAGEQSVSLQKLVAHLRNRNNGRL